MRRCAIAWTVTAAIEPGSALRHERCCGDCGLRAECGLDHIRIVTDTVDSSPLRKALAQPDEAPASWQALPDGDPLKPHLYSAVIQWFEFSYALSIRLLRRVLCERAASADRFTDLSFNERMRQATDAGMVADPLAWRAWREVRTATSHTYEAFRAIVVATGALGFVPVARAAAGHARPRRLNLETA